MEHHEERRFTPEELEELVARIGKGSGSTHRSRNARQKEGRSPATPANDNMVAPEEEKDEANFRSVKAGCVWVQSTLERGERLPEPEWYAQASIVGRCVGGERLFHDLSKADPRYDADETQAKLEHALADAGPRTCANIHESLGFEGCTNCPFWNRQGFTSPLQLGRESTTSAELMATHVFDLASECYINLASRKRYTEKKFSHKFRHRTGKSTPHHLVISHRFTRKVECTDYLPGVDDLFVDEAHGEALNLWQPGGVRPEPGDTDLIDQHLAYLMPAEDERVPRPGFAGGRFV